MQYKVEPFHKNLVNIREQLRELEKDGWELIAIVHQPNALEKVPYSGYLAYFKKA